MKTLIVEDFRTGASDVLRTLRAQGIDATACRNADWRTAASCSLWVVLWTHPDSEALINCRNIRNHHAAAPILMLVARLQPHNTIAALDAGVDDVASHPIHDGELLARVRALSRRIATVPPASAVIKAGPVCVDEVHRAAFVDGVRVELTMREFELLAYLVCRPGTPHTPATLLADVWRMRADLKTNVVAVHVGNLRRKLGAASRCILTVRGVGYMFVA
jgi:DNA-binding response OmpR family regulator